MTTRSSPDDIVVSVIVAAFNSAAWIEKTLESIQNQRLAAIEIIVIDDGSTDDTAARVRRLADSDPRLRLVALPRNGGAAAARNAGLALARGTWISIVDSDDLVSPDRLGRLLDAAEGQALDILCDNLVLFQSDAPHITALLIADMTHPLDIGAARYVHHNCMRQGVASFGYLQPLIRTSTMRRLGVAYAEDLVVAEDFDLILRLLVRGASMRLYPWATYFYRRHGRSLSHRLTPDHLTRMLRADDRFRAADRSLDPALRRALDLRRRNIGRLLVFSLVVQALKDGRFTAATIIILRSPTVLVRLGHALHDRWRRQRLEQAC